VAGVPESVTCQELLVGVLVRTGPPSGQIGRGQNDAGLNGGDIHPETEAARGRDRGSAESRLGVGVRGQDKQGDTLEREGGSQEVVWPGRDPAVGE